ncbi:MAG: SurA N-terminal domain-containing protein [Patescibacteria group bacterium]
MSKEKKSIISKIKFPTWQLCEKFKKFCFKKENLKLTPVRIVILSFVLLLVVLFLAKSLIFSAFVNGRPIFRLSVVSVAEKQDGSVILENLIEKKLILSEAKKEGIKISDQDVASEIENIEEILKGQDITLDQALELSNQNIKSLKEQIKIQKIVELILGKNIVIEESEISEYFETNKEYFGVDAKIEDVKSQIQEELFKQKLTTEYTKWIEELKVSAKIKYIVNY